MDSKTVLTFNQIEVATHQSDIPISDVVYYLRRYVSYPSPAAAIAHALWITHCHAMTAWHSTPRIAFLSPEPASGKSRALEVTELLVPNAVNAINASVAYLFRKAGDEENPPTILYDECDTVWNAKGNNEDIRALINAGHRRHSKVGRCVPNGKNFETIETSAYCAVALAGLGALPDTILSRSVAIRMRRRSPTESIRAYREREVADEAKALNERLSEWVGNHVPELQSAKPAFPDGVQDRAADVWEPLLNIADMAGGGWPEMARMAASELVSDSVKHSPSLGITLLEDLWQVFLGHKRLSTETILRQLIEMPEGPWQDIRGKALDSIALSRLLKAYGVRSKLIRFPGTTNPLRGYEAADLRDAWQRYLPQPNVQKPLQPLQALQPPN